MRQRDRREEESANQQISGIAAQESGESEMQINPKSVFCSSSMESQLSSVPASLPVSPLIIHSSFLPLLILFYCAPFPLSPFAVLMFPI